LGPPRRSSRQRALAELHGLDLRPLEKARERTARPAGEVMPRVLSKLRMEQRQGETEIIKVWNRLMDPNVARHAQPTGLHNGTLFVTIDSSVWLDEIVRYRRKEILDRLQHSFGRDKVKRISYRVG
jgi:predicted nucleic acid-binding Zn ribbon protein